MKKQELKESKGITLVALVVTIIVLLILASVTLAMITGENGIIAKAKEAKEKTEKATWEERIDLAIIEVEGEKRNPTLEDVIDKLYDNDIIDDKENDVDRKTGAITTNEPEYVIEGKLDDYLDNQGGGEEPEEPESPPVYEEGNITFSYNPTTMTNKDVQVTITKNVEENYTIEYSKYDTNNWQEYTGPVDMEKNGAIYARLKNSSGSSEKYATGNVANIDKLPPNEPTLQIGTVTENSIQVTANTTDQTATSENANSGIKGYQFSKDNGANWEPSTPQASGSYTFTSLTEDTEYQIKVKAIDNASNETVSSNTLTQKTEASGTTAGDIAGDTSAIGKEVTGYECTNSAGVNKWLIFYADEKNIYLIADDYISATYCPNGAKGSKIYQNSNAYKLSMDNVISDYAGATSITNSTIKALNNDYFTKYGSQNRSNNNMKAVAYMLDTNVWSVYKGEKAEYAIGGPTIELFFKSYNKKYETNYVAGATSVIGYKIGSGSASGTSLTLSKDKTLPYVVTSTSKANSTWLASPSAHSNNYVFYVNYDRPCGL